MNALIDREKLLKAIGKAQVDNTNTALSFGLMEAHHIILTQEIIPFAEVAMERYWDLCNGRDADFIVDILHNRDKFKAWLEGMERHVKECDKLSDELRKTHPVDHTHEAKPMTMEDIERIHNINLAGTWPFNTPPYLWITKKSAPSQNGWICWRDICYILENRDERLNRKNYGSCWRLWTKKPTDEQTRAVKWMQHDIDELLEEIQGRIPDMLYEELKKAIKK